MLCLITPVDKEITQRYNVPNIYICTLEKLLY